MKRTITIAISSIFLVALLLGTFTLQADGLDDLKLRYFFLTKHFHDQDRELDDLSKQNIDPAKNTRIDIVKFLPPIPDTTATICAIPTAATTPTRKLFFPFAIKTSARFILKRSSVMCGR
jgi:hypothetical protein